MITLEIPDKQVNFEALDHTLQGLLGDLYGGLSSSDQTVVVFMAQGTPQALIEAAYQAVLAHDPHQLTPHQQTVIAFQAQLTLLRETVRDVVVTEAAITQLPEPLQTLAHKLQWLELELRAIQGQF